MCEVEEGWLIKLCDVEIRIEQTTDVEVDELNIWEFSFLLDLKKKNFEKKFETVWSFPFKTSLVAPLAFLLANFNVGNLEMHEKTLVDENQ